MQTPSKYWPIVDAWNPLHSSHITCAYVIVVLCWLAIGGASSAQEQRTVVISGHVAPGAGPGVEFASIGTPFLNRSENTVFSSSLIGPGVNSDNQTALWRELESGFSLIVREGDQAPGTEQGAVFDSFLSVSFDGAAQSTFFSQLRGAAGNIRGIWRNVESGTALVVRQGLPAPGTVGEVNVGTFESVIYNDSGLVAYDGRLTGSDVNSGNSEGIWRETRSGLEIVARSGNSAPDTGGGTFDGFNVIDFNDSGQIVFAASANVPGFPIQQFGIWRDFGAGLQLVAMQGQPAPGFVPGTSLGVVRDPFLTNSGQILFAAGITGNGMNETALYRFNGNSFELIAVTGEQAPGTDDGVNFNVLSSQVIDETGQVVFVGLLQGPGVDSSNRQGIWRDGDNGLELIVREGDQAPGASDGIRFAIFNTPYFNSVGKIAFSAQLIGPGVQPSNDLAIWAEDNNGDLRIIVREGDVLDVNDDPNIDDLRTILILNFGTNSIVNRPDLFINNQLSFRTVFTDGSQGGFVYRLQGIPGDLNGDGLINLLDIEPFIIAIANGEFVPEGDINLDGAVNLLDVGPFVDLLSGS